MSDIFDLDTQGQRSLASNAQSNLLQPGQNHPGFWHGVPKAIGMGILRGGAETADTLQTLGRFFDEPGIDHQDTDQLAADIHHQSVDYWTPGANEVGTAGKVLGGFAEIALPLMATAGNPSLLIGTETNKTGKQLVDQGVDASTATGVAVVQGVATAAGFKIPFLGSNLITRMASGAAGNLTVNAGSAEISHAILKAGGYEEAAKSFDPLDVEARLVDLLSGVAFGGLAHLATPTMRDAAGTAANAKHFQFDTAPGDPADITASMAHQKAMEAAMRDTLAGESVDLSGTGIDTADFVTRDRSQVLTETPEELRGVDEAINKQPTENPERVALPKQVTEGKALEVPVETAQPQSSPTAGETRVVDPVVSSARAAIATNDFPIPTGEIDQDGRVITRSAREMMDQADQDVAKAQNDSKAFDALASCILSRGNG